MDVVKLYRSGLSLNEVSRRSGVSIYYIKKSLTNAGEEIRKNTNYQNINIDIDRANRLYNAGQSTYAIAKVFKCSAETIRKLIKSTRSTSEANKLRDKNIRIKISKSCKAKWADPEYSQKVRKVTSTSVYKKKLSNAAKKNYNETLGKWIRSEDGKLAMSAIASKLWASREYRAKQEIYYAERGRKLYEAFKKNILDNPARREQWIQGIRKRNVANRANGWISSTQRQLYFLLESSGIRYHEEGKETAVGPFYVVDCIIPKQQNMKNDLIIEVQGEYWHALQHVSVKDKQKATYIKRYTNYDLL